MGEVVVQVDVENTLDVGAFGRGYITAAQVRRMTTNAIVDTGAVMMMLPQDLVEALGIEVLRKVVVTYADERKEERSVAGPITIRVQNRQAIVECIVGPPTGEALLGQVPLELMDLLVDCGSQQLRPRPESPFLPLLRLK